MNRYKVTFSDDTIMRLYAEIQDKVSLVKILGEYYRGYKKAYEWLIFLVDNDSIKNFRKAAMCNINEHNTLISFFLQNARRIYKCILYFLFQQPKKTSVNNTETPFLVTTLVLKRKVNVTVIIFDIASPVCVISVMKFANNQKHCKYA